MWLLFVSLAAAQPALRVPVGERWETWSDAAALAGLVEEGGTGEGEVRVVVVEGRWSVEARLGAAVRSATIPAPTTPAAREDAALLGRSLLRELQAEVPGDAVPPVTGEPGPATEEAATEEATAADPGSATGDPGPATGDPGPATSEPVPPAGNPAAWSGFLSLRPVYVAPRSFGDQGFGGEVGGEVRRGALGVDVTLRAVGPRTLHDVTAAQWWLPVDVRVGVGWRGRGATRLVADGVVGVSLRAYGEGTGVVQLDPKPVAGASLGLEADVAPRWVVGGGLGLTADLGATRIEGRGEPYVLGLVELDAHVGVGWRFW